MARRPAWKVDGDRVYMGFHDFKWNPGQAPVQKRKNIKALHESIGGKTLEISTKSEDEFGERLSPFNMTLNGTPLEVLYQAGKVFENGGPYLDILEKSPKDAKRDPRLKNSGPIKAFVYEGEEFPANPRGLFYNYLYYKSVMDNFTPEEIKQLQNYDYFTDIEFNPNKSHNTQARAAALLKLLLDKNDGVLPDLTPEEFLDFQNEALKYEII